MPSLKDAQRLANVMASDIQAYNTNQIRRGIENDTLFEELHEDLRDADRNWRERMAPEFSDEIGLFHRAFVDQIFATSGKIPSKIF